MSATTRVAAPTPQQLQAARPPHIPPKHWNSILAHAKRHEDEGFPENDVTTLLAVLVAHNAHRPPAEGIYIASRVARAGMWRDLRAEGWPIVSTWIDEDGEGETDDYAELWPRIQGEIERSAGLIFYGHTEDAPWKGLRAEGWPIVSTWIDEDGEGETDDYAELWPRIQGEIERSAGLIFYGHTEDAPWKGALVEVGMALAMGKPVHAVIVGDLLGRTMRPIGSWLDHPSVRRTTLLTALNTLAPPQLGAAPMAAPVSALERERIGPIAAWRTVVDGVTASLSATRPPEVPGYPPVDKHWEALYPGAVVKKAELALHNCKALAMREVRRDPTWQHVLRFCTEAGYGPSPFRGAADPVEEPTT